MLQTVDVGELSLDSYRGVAPEATLDELARRAEGCVRARVLHLNAIPYGGGVSELPRSAAPLLNDPGIVAHWQVIGGGESFFEATKTMHDALRERCWIAPRRSPVRVRVAATLDYGL